MKPKALASIADLTPDPRNPRRRTPRNLEMIRGALAEVGAARSIVVDENGRILAGNGTVEAAGAAGIKRVRVIDADGKTLIAVRRSGLSEEQKRRLSLLDNRTAELAEWDPGVLAELKAADFPLTDLFDARELNIILTADQEQAVDDEVPEPPKKAVTRPGDLYLLGRHRLLCGDATRKDDVARLLGNAAPALMVTDPPYGVAYDPEWRVRADRVVRSTGKVTNDDRADWTEALSLFPGDVAYVWHAATFVTETQASLRTIGFEIRAQIVWIKQHFTLSRGDYHWQHESCWYAVRKGKASNWIGDRSQSTIWQIANRSIAGGKKDDASTEHSTQKPVECMARPLRNHGGDVFDPFLGSGTTLIAAEQIGRACYGLEIDARYCDVIVERFEKFTGEKAKRERSR